MTTSNYNTGFPQGVTIRNVPVLDIQNGDGNVFWVNSVTGSDANKGTFKYPLKSIVKALTLVKPDQGDKIFLAAGHEETIDNSNASTYDVNVSGIQIIGMGTSENRAVFYIDGTTSANALTVSANNVYLGNFSIQPSISPSGTYDRFLHNNNSNGTVLENISLLDTSFAVALLESSGNRVKIIGCKLTSGDFGNSATEAILISGTSDSVEVINCVSSGRFPRGNIKFANDDVTNFVVDGGSYKNTSNAGYFLHSEATSASTAMISNNVNFRVTNLEKLPIYSENNAKIGIDNLGEVISISTIVNVSKIVVSSAYLLDVQSGSYLLENVIWETDSAALGGATNVAMKKEGSDYGNAIFFEETVATLGGLTTIELADASVVSKGAVLATDTKIQINASGATLTGNDNRITFKLRSLESGSNIIKNPSF